MDEISQSHAFAASRAELAFKWASAARWAASGGNSQPWEIRFCTSKNNSSEIQFTLQIDPNYKNGPSPMDVDGKASVIALGCYAVYLESLAQYDGYALVNTVYESQGPAWDFRVILTFDARRSTAGHTKNESITEPSLYSRWTDRLPFKNSSCPQDLKARLQETIRRHPSIASFSFADTRDSLISPLRRLEQLRWENSKFRDALFEEISFAPPTSNQSERKIPSTQLGASAMEQVFLHALFRIPGLRKVLDFGAAYLIARKTIATLIHNSSEVIWLQTKVNTNANCFEMGRCFQSLWLEINQYGFSFQPIGLPLVALSYWQGDVYQIAKKARHAKAITEVTEIFRTEFAIDLKQPVLGFRFGPTRHPQSAATRKSPRAAPRIFQD